MLSYQAMVFSQAGQNERAGDTTERSRGNRKMHTFKKLPISNPASNASSTTSIREPRDTHAMYSSPAHPPKTPVVLVRGRRGPWRLRAAGRRAAAAREVENRRS